MSGVRMQERPLCHARRAQYCETSRREMAASEAEMRKKWGRKQAEMWRSCAPPLERL